MPKLQYELRPAKHIVRRMIVEGCRQLSHIAPLSKYQYVGFGGLEFVDFQLVHRELGINEMQSIEHDTTWPERYEFNKPFKGVTVHMGKASAVLPTLDWDGLRVVWLDYEQALDEEVIRDCEGLGRLLHQGSVLVVTVRASAEYGKRLQTLKSNVGDVRVPFDVTEAALNKPWAFAWVQCRILTEALDAVCSQRGDGARLRQIFNFSYADAAKMQTLGWVVTSAALDQTVRDGCRFEDLDFCRSGEGSFLVEVPTLTAREIAYLNQRLPLTGRRKLHASWLDGKAQEHYSKLYTWYPAH
jgi:hypothetical protein